MTAISVSRLGPDRIKELTLAATILASLIAFGLLIDEYFSGRFFNRLTLGVAIVAVVAAGQSLVILTRNIDLSVGSIVGVSAYVTGQQLGEHPDMHVLVAIGFAVGLGASLGLINGLLVAVARIPSIIVTLGTLAIYRTALINYGDAQTITADTLPSWLVDLPKATVFSIGDYDLRFMFALAIGVVLALQLAMGRLRLGRRLYALGSNPDAARQAGLSINRLTVLAFIGCGAFSGLGGFLFLARFGTITVTAGQGLELQAIAAAVVGGVSTLGGAGTLVGALFGALLIEVLNQSLVRLPAVSEFWRDAVLGLLILIAVILDALLARRLNPGRPRILAGTSSPGRDAAPPSTGSEDRSDRGPPVDSKVGGTP
ncbi:MAG: ABC transporter permease [Acidimicrobiales bacterium]